MSDKDHRNTAAYILASAHKVVTTERGNQHGGAEDSFQMIADLWATYLNNTPKNITMERIEVTAYDVAQMMSLLKIARAVHGDPLNDDNYVDASGYQSLAAAIAGVKAPVKAEPTRAAEVRSALEGKGLTQPPIPIAKHTINTPPAQTAPPSTTEDDALSAVASALGQEIKP